MSFELDIRARLGKLPKNLSGVYDEIMISIESRPGMDFELATRALKWMLVSRWPLKPQELVAATELNPSSIPPDRPADDQRLQPGPEPALDVELVIHVCGGLIFLDHGLNVMRFAHLSVPEYLETRKNSWGIIDAQRFVSEGCLWTLQCGPSPTSALYDYAGRTWFRHCRSYQDITLSQSTQDPSHALDIPILNTFLGSFDCASIYFTEWVSWVKTTHVYGLRLSPGVIASSEPPSPAFMAAASGIGELVSWLWHSEGVDMNIKNECNQSLLYLASSFGTTWIMTCVLTQVAQRDIDQDDGWGPALSGAASSGLLENAMLLLDRGADINYIFGGVTGTALGEAAFYGELEMATLLVDRGAEINITFGSICGTALGVAAYMGGLEIATLLLDRGADINLTFDGEYGTALGAAVASSPGNLEVATLLLDHGANPDLTNHVGQKPRDLAELKLHNDMVDLLNSYIAGKTENQMNHTQAPADGSKDEGANCRELR